MANTTSQIAENISQIISKVDVINKGINNNVYNFCKIKGNAFIQKQIEHKNGRIFMRSKKRNLILIKPRGESRVIVNNINHGKFDGMYHL